MASKGTVTVRIVGDDSGLKGTLASVESGFGSFAKKAAVVGGAIGGAFAVDKIIDFGASSVKAFAESEQASAKLSDAFARFPKLADSNAAAFEKQAEALAKTTRFDDDATKTSQALLAQYKLTGAQIQQLTPLVQDYAAKTGKDLPAAAEAMGKAILGKGAALKQIGVNFKDTGDAGKNFELVMGALSAKVGGFAEKEGQTAAGKLEILKNQFGEVQEQIGAKLMPVLLKLADFTLTKVIPAIEKGVQVISAWAPAIGGFAISVKNVAVGAIQFLVDKMLGAAEWIATAAAKAFGWVPGIGGKLRTAAAEIEAFRDSVNGALSGIKAVDPFRTVARTSVNDTSEVSRFGKEVKKAYSAAGKDAGTGFVDNLASNIGGKAAAPAKAAAKKTAKEIAAEFRSQVGDIFSAFSAMDGRTSAQRAVVAATESLNEALARQATLPVVIAKARRELTAAQADAAKTTDEEALAVVQARKAMTAAESRYKELLADATATAEDLTEAELQQRIARTEYTRAQREALAPTEAVTAAQEKLKDLEAEQVEITKAVTDAQAALTQARLDSVQAELSYLEAAKKSNDVTKEAVDLFRQLAEKAGLSREEIGRLAGAFGNLQAGGGGAVLPSLGSGNPFPQLAGVPGVTTGVGGAPFVNGERVSFRDGVPYAGGKPVVPSFASGGIMPGRRGAPGLAMLHGGETILPTHQAGGGGTSVSITIPSSGVIPADVLRSSLYQLNRLDGPLKITIRG